MLDSAMNDTTLTSGTQSLSEMETEFKRELAASAKEYTQMVKREEGLAGASTTDLSSNSSEIKNRVGQN